MEPIGGQASGVNVPHPSFARGARAICDRHGIRLVFDESVCVVRTGRFLAARLVPDALPDVVVLAADEALPVKTIWCADTAEARATLCRLLVALG